MADKAPGTLFKEGKKGCEKTTGGINIQYN
jgi:hypothetical protein